MIYNKEAYYTGYARNVRTFGGGSKGAYTALVFDTIAGLIRDKGIGEVANKTLLDMLGGTKPTLLAAIELIISTGYLERNTSCGRGNKCIYYITEKGKENCPFMADKRSKNFTEKVKNFNEKGKEILPINKVLNKEINKESSSFEGNPQKPKMEEEEKIFNEEINKSELEKQALERVKNLFADNNTINKELRATFGEFWNLYNVSKEQECKYKVALQEWADMPENCRQAALYLLEHRAKPTNPNPYFFLQHFRETKFFLNEREQYDAYKNGIQLCRVRYKNQQRVMAAVYAQAFQMEIIDEHYEKRFEI